MVLTAPTVLVVDDDAALRTLMARMLATEGYNVVAAADGTEALRIAEELVGQIPLVVTDVTMPVMDGVELARALARLIPAPLVLFVSGYAAPTGHELPGPFLAKPFRSHELAQCVHTLLKAAE